MTARRVLPTAAVLWTAVLIPLAFLAPAYQGESASSNGETTHATATFVGINGHGIVALLCVPLGLALIAWFALRRGSRAAWLPIGVFGLFALVGAASIGLFYLPPALALVASGYRPASRFRSGGSSI
jgi:hypothetical protein